MNTLFWSSCQYSHSKRTQSTRSIGVRSWGKTFSSVRFNTCQQILFCIITSHSFYIFVIHKSGEKSRKFYEFHGNAIFFIAIFQNALHFSHEQFYRDWEFVSINHFRFWHKRPLSNGSFVAFFKNKIWKCNHKCHLRGRNCFHLAFITIH